ncbi:MAG: RNA recognition motif domain-containing protein [Saprospiraceae bacterium]
MNIFIKKLSYDTTESTLRAAFEKFGKVSNCNIVMDKVTQKSKRFGFVEMQNEKKGNKAIAALHKSKLDGNTIMVKETKQKREEPKE